MSSSTSTYRKKQKERLQSRIQDDPSLLNKLQNDANICNFDETSIENNTVVLPSHDQISIVNVVKEHQILEVEHPDEIPENLETGTSQSLFQHHENFKVGVKPNELCLDMAKIASKHNLSDSCLADVLKLIRKEKISDDSILPANLRRWKKNMLISDFTTTTYWKCKICNTFHNSSSTGLNFECCGKKSTQNDDHHIIFDIEQLLTYTLPQLFDHISLEDECSFDQNLRNANNLTDDDIIITMNTDGAPLFSSSNSSTWPVLAYINGCSERRKKYNILLLGLWIGKEGGKPDFNILLGPIIEKLSFLSTSGMTWETLDGSLKKTRVFVSKVLCDSMARPPVMKMMQFNSTFGCCVCFHDESGHYFTFSEELSESRTHEGHLEICEELKKKEKTKQIKGVTGLSPFLGLTYFDLIKGFPPEILHLLDLGITKHFTGLWIDSTNHKLPFYISEKSRQQIDKKIEAIKPPCRVSRLPRGLKYLKFFKGHELNMWCLYYSPIILRNVLPPEYYENWIHLVFAISLLVKENIDDDDIEIASKNIDDFAREIKDLYGHQSERFNVHLLRHLPEFVKLFGSPQKNAMNCFENFNAVLSNHVSSSQFLVSQIANRYLRDLVLNHFEPRIYTVSNTTGRLIGTCRLMNSMKSYNCSKSEYDEIRKEQHSTRDLTFYQYIYINEKRIHSRSYAKFQRRNNECVLTDTGAALDISSFFYNKKLDCVMAMGTEHRLNSALNLDHIFVSISSSTKIINVEKLGEILLKIEDEGEIFFCKFLNNYSHYNE